MWIQTLKSFTPSNVPLKEARATSIAVNVGSEMVLITETREADESTKNLVE